MYHIGASLKDLGKKWFAFSKMNKDSVASIVSAVGELIEVKSQNHAFTKSSVLIMPFT